MNFLATRTAYHAKAETSVEFSAFFEPRSGEDRISGRDEGVSEATDGSRRRNVSGAAFPLKGDVAKRQRVGEVGLQKEHRLRGALFVVPTGIEPVFKV